MTAVLERLEQDRPQLLALEGELQRTCESLKNTTQLATSLDKRELGLKRALEQVAYITENLGETEKKIPLLEKNFRQRLEERTQAFLAEFAEKRLAETEKRLLREIEAMESRLALTDGELEKRSQISPVTIRISARGYARIWNNSAPLWKKKSIPSTRRSGRSPPVSRPSSRRARSSPRRTPSWTS